MKTECPHCKQHYEVDDNYLGSVVTCESCKQDFVVENKSSDDSNRSDEANVPPLCNLLRLDGNSLER